MIGLYDTTAGEVKWWALADLCIKRQGGCFTAADGPARARLTSLQRSYEFVLHELNMNFVVNERATKLWICIRTVGVQNGDGGLTGRKLFENAVVLPGNFTKLCRICLILTYNNE